MTKEIIATASSTVNNGRSSTSNLQYTEGHDRSSLVPGHTYDINAEYQENGNYEYSENIGTLEMLKCPTTSTITGSTTNPNPITGGGGGGGGSRYPYVDTTPYYITLTVKENIGNTNITQGTFALYVDNTLVQNNYVITGNTTTISYIFTTAGTHDVYTIFTDSGVEYNTSTSNHLSVTAAKKPTYLSAPSSLSIYLGDSATISGNLTGQSNRIVENQTIKLVDYDGMTIQTTTTNNAGYYEFTYTPTNWNVNGKNIKVVYDGTNVYNNVTKTIPVTLQRHDVTITVPDTTGFIDDTVNIPITLTDENGDPVTSGTVSVELEPILVPWTIYKGTFDPETFKVTYSNLVFDLSETEDAQAWREDGVENSLENNNMYLCVIPTEDVEGYWNSRIITVGGNYLEMSTYIGCLVMSLWDGVSSLPYTSVLGDNIIMIVYNNLLDTKADEYLPTWNNYYPDADRFPNNTGYYWTYYTYRTGGN